MTGDGHTGTSNTIEALVVDDSTFMRAVIVDILERNDITVIGEAADGREAVTAVERLEPDVVTMDIEMPVMDGIEAVEVIMNRRPTPILVLSSHAGEDAEVTFEALDRGAVDFFTKPGGEVSTNLPSVETRLVETIKSVARSTPSSPADGSDAVVNPVVDTPPNETSPILAIAASTGGPTVLDRLLSKLPIEANFRILIVQHMPSGFTERFADRLDRASEYAISEAHHGMELSPGEGVLAQGGAHLLVDAVTEHSIRLSLDEREPVHNVMPAADVTFSSLANHDWDELLAVVVTGMGADGAAGAEQLKRAGATVIAQDEESSAVFGMPQRTIETGCVDTIASERELATEIVKHLDRREQTTGTPAGQTLGMTGGEMP